MPDFRFPNNITKMITILFFVSLFVLVALIASKVFEAKITKRTHLVSNVLARGDVKIHQFIDLARFKYRVYKKIVWLFLFDFLPSLVYEILVKLKDYVAKKYYSTGDNFRGRRILRSNGSVSAFLEQLSEKPTDRLNHKI